MHQLLQLNGGITLCKPGCNHRCLHMRLVMAQEHALAKVSSDMHCQLSFYQCSMLIYQCPSEVHESWPSSMRRLKIKGRGWVERDAVLTRLIIIHTEYEHSQEWCYSPLKDKYWQCGSVNEQQSDDSSFLWGSNLSVGRYLHNDSVISQKTLIFHNTVTRTSILTK